MTKRQGFLSRSLTLLGKAGESFGLQDAAKWERLKARGTIGGLVGGPTWAGENVSAEAAMQLSTVWRCVRLISETIGSLPFGLVSDDSKFRSGKGEIIDTIIRFKPNADQTALQFWEAMAGAVELTGNAFARKHYSGTGAARRIIALELLHPWRVTPQKDNAGRKFWQYTTSDGHQFEWAWDDVFHLCGFSLNGEWGMSTVGYGAQSIGASMAADRTSSAMFKSGLSSSGFLQTGQVLNEPDRLRLQELMAEYMGSGNAGRLMILEAGMVYNPLSMSAQDAQLLTSRQFNVEELCRWFGVPPILVGHAANGVSNWGSGIEQIILAWLQLGLRSRLIRIQQAVKRQLFTPAQQVEWNAKFNIDALLQGDSAARLNYLSGLLQNGIYNRNEARAKLDEAPIPGGGGDVYTAQVNLAPLDQLGQTDGQATATRNALRAWLLDADDEAPPRAPGPPA